MCFIFITVLLCYRAFSNRAAQSKTQNAKCKKQRPASFWIAKATQVLQNGAFYGAGGWGNNITCCHNLQEHGLKSRWAAVPVFWCQTHLWVAITLTNLWQPSSSPYWLYICLLPRLHSVSSRGWTLKILAAMAHDRSTSWPASYCKFSGKVLCLRWSK